MNLFLFGEGKTEILIMRKLIQHFFAEDSPIQSMEIIQTKGREKQFAAIERGIGTNLQSPEGTGCVILVDRDVQDTIASLQQRWTNGMQKIFNNQGIDTEITLAPLQSHSNVLCYQSPPEFPPIRIVLHIAASPDIPNIQGYPFLNATTDDYILAVAMAEGVLNRFAQRAHIPAEVIRHKIAIEIPTLLEENKYPNLEAKDAISMYITATRFLKLRRAVTDEETTFASLVIDRAIHYAPNELEQIFASTIASVRELESEIA